MRRRIRAVLVLACLACLLPAFGLAAEPAAEAGSVSPFAGDLGNAIWTIVIFLLVVFVLGKWAWNPILSTLQRREEFIRDALASAKADREKAEAVLKGYEERLAHSRAEATAIVEEGRRDAEAVRRRIEEEARQDAERMLARAKREIGIAKETAVKELYQTSAHLATELAGRILERELTGEDHERLIAQSIEGLGRIGKE